jgi:hypothetical protein
MPGKNGDAMRTPTRACLLVATLAAVAGAWPAGVLSQGTTARSPEAAFQEECGACHWAYAPELLPARSWRAITKDLTHHFGQNASLDEPTVRQITDYLVSHAADAQGSDHTFMRGLGPGDTPMRITDTPLWRAIHERVSSFALTQQGVKTMADCMGCHRG